MIRVRRALVSVSDKTGLPDLVRALVAHGVEIISTGGTAAALKKEGFPVTEVSEVTGFPEMLDGRVKTLHPRIFAGILFRRDQSGHVDQVTREKIAPVDMVVVNLYPFEKVVSAGCSREQAIENIDIGGPSLLRAAAKNCEGVIVLSDPLQYQALVAEMEREKGRVSVETARALGAAVFEKTACYDLLISQYLAGEGPPAAFPERLPLLLEKKADLRYGENPHQRAALYRERSFRNEIGLLVDAEQLQGKELSYNNYLDLQAALGLAQEFEREAAVVVKHNNPCGTALGPDLVTAFRRARAGDPVSAFGGIIALNRPVDAETAREIIADFVECVIAPEFSREALAVFAGKKDLRLLRLPWDASRPGRQILRPVSGGFLRQDEDAELFEELRIAGRKEPSSDQLDDLRFAFTVAKHTKSNTIILARDGQTIGVGAGQMSRLDSAKIAVAKAREFGFAIKGAAAASDAFFPFPDALEILAREGIAAVIHPGGSRNDALVTAAAEKHGVAVVLSGRRHFLH